MVTRSTNVKTASALTTQDLSEIVRQAAKFGDENLVGGLTGGVDDLSGAGGEIANPDGRT